MEEKLYNSFMIKIEKYPSTSLSFLFCFLLVFLSSDIDFYKGQIDIRYLLICVALTLLYFIISKSMSKIEKDKFFTIHFKLPSDFNDISDAEHLPLSVVFKTLKFFFIGMYIKALLPALIISVAISIHTKSYFQDYVFNALLLALRFTVAIVCIRFLWHHSSSK